MQHSHFSLHQTRSILGSLFISLLLVLLAACSTSNITITPAKTPTSTPIAKPTTIPSGTVLYQLDSTHGLNNWHGSPGWSVTQGYLQSAVRDNDVIVLPYKPTTPNYAVEVHFQIVNVPIHGGFFSVSADPLAGKDGYTAGILGFLGPGPHSQFANPEVNSFIQPLDDMDGRAVLSDYEPGSIWHTYRITIEGPQVSFYIDGLRKSFATSSQTNYLSNGPIQLKAAAAIIRVDSIRILAA